MSRLTPAQETAMFGMTEKEMLEQFNFFPKSGDRDTLMYAMQIMSDAQMMLELGETETARQFMNKAKYFISNVWANLPRE